jgi:hypothetical protein
MFTDIRTLAEGDRKQARAVLDAKKVQPARLR